MLVRAMLVRPVFNSGPAKILWKRAAPAEYPSLAQAHFGRVFLEQCLKARVIAEQVPSRSETQHEQGNGSEPYA